MPSLCVLAVQGTATPCHIVRFLMVQRVVEMTRNMAIAHNAACCKQGIKEIHYLMQGSQNSKSYAV